MRCPCVRTGRVAWPCSADDEATCVGVGAARLRQPARRVPPVRCLGKPIRLASISRPRRCSSASVAAAHGNATSAAHSASAANAPCSRRRGRDPRCFIAGGDVQAWRWKGAARRRWMMGRGAVDGRVMKGVVVIRILQGTEPGAAMRRFGAFCSQFGPIPGMAGSSIVCHRLAAIVVPGSPWTGVSGLTNAILGVSMVVSRASGSTPDCPVFFRGRPREPV